LALFGIACPFGPPSLFEIPQRESLFKSKYRLTLEPVSLDPRFDYFISILSFYSISFRGKLILNYTDHDLTQIGSGYNWIHSDDLKYYSTAHKECKKSKFRKTKTNFLLLLSIKNRNIRSSLLSYSNKRCSLAMVTIINENNI
jgi:hypothetical protein